MRENVEDDQMVFPSSLHWQSYSSECKLSVYSPPYLVEDGVCERFSPLLFIYLIYFSNYPGLKFRTCPQPPEKRILNLELVPPPEKRICPAPVEQV